MRSLESMAIENVSADEAYIKAKKTLGRSEVDIGNFADFYGDSIVHEDEEFVEEMEAKFAESANPDMERVRKLAVIFEAIFNDHAELSNWLGSGVFMAKASRFDDIKNGVDSIAEFQEGEGSASHLALAIDVTMSTDMREKFERIKREIDDDELTEVKYFKSEHEGTRGSLSKIPRVVVGANAGTIKNISDLWMDGDNKALANHPLQFQVLEEILLQLRVFNSYAEEVGQLGIAETYDDMYKVVDSIYKERVSSVNDTGQRDSAFYAMEEYLENF